MGLTTITTVGYGDVYPVTGLGRVNGIVIMCIGVGVFGVFTAALASHFVSSSDDEGMVRALTRIDKRLGAIERRLE